MSEPGVLVNNHLFDKEQPLRPSDPDAVLYRLFRRSRANQVAIAVGSGLSPAEWSIPHLAKSIIDAFHLNFFVPYEIEFFRTWNSLIQHAEEQVGREEVVGFLQASLNRTGPSELHKLIARIPVSNFIDTTFDRTIVQALEEAGRQPIFYDWNRMMIGNWQQSNPKNPSVFFALPDILDPPPFVGIYEPTGQFENIPVQIENMGEMLNEKDMALVGIGGYEAEHVLHLERLCAHCDKICADRTHTKDSHYWPQRGVYVGRFGTEDMIRYLLPRWGTEYSEFDAAGLPFMIDMARSKKWDCFISYFSGDSTFVDKLANNLRVRDLRVWRDTEEILIGDSIVGRIEEGLSDSYTFVIVLSPEALQRSWVREELHAAYGIRALGDFKILPVLHTDCELPPFLATYKYADFRDPSKYHEQLGMLEYAIKEAVKKARKKK